MRVLLIEDDAMIARSLTQALGDAGMAVDWTADGALGREAIWVGGHDIVLLDLGLGPMDGLALLSELRGAGNRVPVLVITARDAIQTRIDGLDRGADDYIVKPFDSAELLARMRAVLRRQAGQAQSVIEAGEIQLDLASHMVAYRGTQALLSAREFALLRALAERPGAILSKAQIEEKLYGWDDPIESNVIDVLIHHIRRRFDKDIIRNIRGAGWMIGRGR